MKDRREAVLDYYKLSELVFRGHPEKVFYVTEIILGDYNVGEDFFSDPETSLLA